MDKQVAIPKLSLSWRMRAMFSGKLPPLEYLTPDIRWQNPGWGDEIFNRQISSLQLYLPTGHRLLLSGMQAYNFFVEACDAIRGRKFVGIKAFWLCGRIPYRDMVDMWRIGDGKVFRQSKAWGQEWGGTATRGWKIGDLNADYFSGIVRGH